jgi:hypothetical protein
MLTPEGLLFPNQKQKRVKLKIVNFTHFTNLSLFLKIPKNGRTSNNKDFKFDWIEI